MINKHRQRGMSGLAIIFLIIILIFTLVVFFKLFPLYMENMTLSSALEKLQEDENITQKMDSEIRRAFLGYLSDKDIELFDNESIKQQMTINRRSGEGIVEITVKYQRTKPLMGNVSFLVDFENRVEAP
jgi:flagellar basal body-associated protein FliL